VAFPSPPPSDRGRSGPGRRQEIVRWRQGLAADHDVFIAMATPVIAKPLPRDVLPLSDSPRPIAINPRKTRARPACTSKTATISIRRRHDLAQLRQPLVVNQVAVLGGVCEAAAFTLRAWAFSALRFFRTRFLRLSSLECLDIFLLHSFWPL